MSLDETPGSDDHQWSRWSRQSAASACGFGGLRRDGETSGTGLPDPRGTAEVSSLRRQRRTSSNPGAGSACSSWRSGVSIARAPVW